MAAPAIPAGSPPDIFSVMVEELFIRLRIESMLRNLCSATSVLMVSSRPRSICESAELILPIALVIRLAVKHGYEYLWIMDDDTIPEQTALEELIKADKLLNGNYGFLSSYVKWIDNSPCEMNVPKLDFNWGKDIAQQFDNYMIRLESASFVSMFVKSDVVKKVGLPIKEFFIWADDVEYSKRISRQYPCYFVYKSQVVHEMGSNKSATIIDTDNDRLGRFELLYRNRYYVAKHGAKRDRILFWIEIKNTIRDIQKSNCKNKGKRIRIVLKSVWKGLSFEPKIEYISKK